jgi:class 3 adenylate cyclase
VADGFWLVVVGQKGDGVSSSVAATFVFTDLVGSTDLMTRVGECAADELRREHLRYCGLPSPRTVEVR